MVDSFTRLSARPGLGPPVLRFRPTQTCIRAPHPIVQLPHVTSHPIASSETVRPTRSTEHTEGGFAPCHCDGLHLAHAHTWEMHTWVNHRHALNHAPRRSSHAESGSSLPGCATEHGHQSHGRYSRTQPSSRGLREPSQREREHSSQQAAVHHNADARPEINPRACMRSATLPSSSPPQSTPRGRLGRPRSPLSPQLGPQGKVQSLAAAALVWAPQRRRRQAARAQQAQAERARVAPPPARR